MAGGPVTIEQELIEYAREQGYTELERRLLIIVECGSLGKAKHQIGISRECLGRQVRRLRKEMARKGWTPYFDATRYVDPGLALHGKSTFTKDPEGNPVWVKTSKDKEDQARAMREFAEGLTDHISKAPARPVSHEDYDSDLMPSIFIGDAHVGMRAYGKETKHHDFDTDIAVQQLRASVDYLVSKAEPSEHGLVVDVGDFHHANGHNNQTFNGTPLDVDTRHRSTMYQGAMAMRYMIDRMLDKCHNVLVVVARGNHNDDVAPAMELMLSFCYEDEPRVRVLETNGYHHYLEFGGNLLGVCHGDKQKPEALAGSMARDMPEAWGRTNFRLWCTGHYHKESVKTLPGCKHKVFGALPPPDGWHSSKGFSGDGEMELLTFRRSGGIQSSFVYRIPRPIIEPDVTI